MLGLLRTVDEQMRRQRSIGLAENLERLQEAETSFNAVFTTSFCFKVRDEVRQGASTLQKLNRHLKGIQFGTDNYQLEWAWVPRLQKVFEFFEAMEGLVDMSQHGRSDHIERRFQFAARARAPRRKFGLPHRAVANDVVAPVVAIVGQLLQCAFRRALVVGQQQPTDLARRFPVFVAQPGRIKDRALVLLEGGCLDVQSCQYRFSVISIFPACRF
jgi:hypothetical protein